MSVTRARLLFRLSVSVVVWIAVGSAAASPLSKAFRESAKPCTGVRAGTVIVIGGIGGWDILPHSARFALPRAGLPHEVRDYVWTHGVGQMLKDLQDFRHVEDKAEQLAVEILELRGRYPERPIYVLAKSAGAGLALRAAELLPAKTIDRMIFLAAAVSPSYDLRPALRATRGEIVSFYSPLDQLLLNLGTRQFGTVDRHYGPSAGLKGFHVPKDLADADRALYERLVQVPWNPRMIRSGYFGGHESNGMPCFLVAEIVPWLK